ncbi:MAG TPA: nitroreductase family protein [Bacillota bacterium]|nr:nitroreductase family protein [Bacillota bacterium]
MDTFQSIYNRRSIRKFTEETVPDHLVKELMKAAMSAPSAMNQQPWHFIVINDRQLLEEIAEIQGGYAMLKRAPMAILVCGEEDKAKLKQFWPLDLAAATENILIAAQPLGLGVTWCGVYPTREFIIKLQEILKLPETITPFSLIPVGFPDETKAKGDRFIGERIHRNGWGPF